MNPPLLRALHGEQSFPPPIWFMRQAGRYLPEYQALRTTAKGFWALMSTPEWAMQITLQPIKRFDLDAAIIFSDILVVPYVLGQKVEFQDTVGPILGPLPTCLVYDSTKLSFVYEALRLTRACLKQNKVLIGFAGGPWTLACYMLGGYAGNFDKARTFFAQDGVKAKNLIQLLTNAVAQHLVAQVQAGAQVLQVFESWASLAPMQKWVIDPMCTIVNHVRSVCPNVPIIGFPRGYDRAGYLAYAEATQVDALGLDEAIDVDWAAQALQNVPCLQGNLSPVLLREGGQALTHEVHRIKRAFAKRPFIFNLGHGISKDTSPEHVAHVVRLVRDQE